MRRLVRGTMAAMLMALALAQTGAPSRFTNPSQGPYCDGLNSAQYPCWFIWLMACECTWPDSAGGGGSGAGEENKPT